MQINATGNTSLQSLVRIESADKMKRLFQKLGQALASGDVVAAKAASTELQKNAPPVRNGESDLVGNMPWREAQDYAAKQPEMAVVRNEASPLDALA